MPNPVGPDLHVNVPLTNVSIAYFQDQSNFVADKVFPIIPVDKQSNLYNRYSKSQWRKTNAQKRAPGTESVGTGYDITRDQYYCDVYAIHKDITDQDRAAADSEWMLDKDATNLVSNDLLLMREIAWQQNFFGTGIWGTDLAGTNTGSGQFPSTNTFLQWDQASSDPIQQFATLQESFIQNSGRKANKLVLGAHAYNALKNHPDLIDRIKYTQKGIVTTDLIATLLDVEKVYVCYASQATGPQMDGAVADDANATYSFIADTKSALLCYAPDSPSLLTPSAGYTFNWKGYLGGNAQGVRMSRFRMEHLKVDRIEGEITYAQKVVCNDMGTFMHAVTA
jgi:hypothetical protein